MIVWFINISFLNISSTVSRMVHRHRIIGRQHIIWFDAPIILSPPRRKIRGVIEWMLGVIHRLAFFSNFSLFTGIISTGRENRYSKHSPHRRSFIEMLEEKQICAYFFGIWILFTWRR